MNVDDELHEAEVQEQLRRLQVQQEARARLQSLAPVGDFADRWARGGDFIFSATEEIPAVWGSGSGVLWAEGEGVMISAHQGVGKTTLAQQLVLHRLGVRRGPFL